MGKQGESKSHRYMYIGAVVGGGIMGWLQLWPIVPIGGGTGATIGAWFDRRRAKEE